jgi:hypothetical protein
VFLRSSFLAQSFIAPSWRSVDAVQPPQTDVPAGGGSGRRGRRRPPAQWPLPLPLPGQPLILPPELPLRPGVPMLPGLPSVDPLPDVRRKRRRQRELEMLVAIGVIRH